MKYKLAIFDMDGTILNTIEDLCDSVNYMLREYHYPERSLEEVKSFVGNGLKVLAKKSLPDGTSEDKVQEFFEKLNAYYEAHCKIKTRPYDNTIETIRKLREAGVKVAVVSNKPDAAVALLVKEYFDGLFDEYVGEKKGINRKPAPDSCIEVLNRLKFSNEDVVYIGDSDVDFETSVNAKVDFIGAAFGFRGEKFLRELGATRIAMNFEDILKFF